MYGNYKYGICDHKENKGFYSRKMLKYDLQALNSRYNIRIMYNKNLKMYELFSYYRKFAIARDIQELYQIISSLNQFRIAEHGAGKTWINNIPIEIVDEQNFLKEYGLKC